MEKDVCRNFCWYYKPARDESLACLGFLVLGKLIGQGIFVSYHKRERNIQAATAERLFRDMCIRCPFYEDDCDFALASRTNRSDSETSAPANSGEIQLFGKGNTPWPCGGFILLGHLLEEKIVNIDDIKKLI